MTSESSEKKNNRGALTVLLAIVILVVFSMVFVLEFLNLSSGSGGLTDEEITASSYLDVVTSLLRDADPEQGAELIEKHGCQSCHGGANAGRLAPGYDELATVAALRRPPMSAPAYIYESIIYPGAFVAEDYQNNMPRVFEDQIQEAELGHIIAYLLSPTAADGETSVVSVFDLGAIPREDLTEDSYMDIVIPLLESADPERGAELVETHGCNACHAGEAADIVAPSHEGLADRAGERVPPLTAAAYIYEAIIYPAAHIADDYPASMPPNYAALIPDNELGDIIAYLLE